MVMAMKVDERKKQMALLQRSRSEIAHATREVVASFKRLGIDAYVNIPDIKEKLAYILIPNSEIVNFMIRKIASYLKKIDKSISIKGGIIDEFVAIKAICTEKDVDLSDIDNSTRKFVEELKSYNITSSVNITKDDYLVINVLVNYIDVSNYLGRESSKAVKQKGLKVGIASYVDSDVFVVRITPR